MPFYITWWDITLRLLLAAVAGAVIGWDRGETGKPAGLRTTLLVCVAAALAMIQANILNHSLGKTSDSFAVMDTMRLPLGILSGMGFIGGGAILRRGKLVIGVTTAATLWFVTVIGLCIGGGQLELGMAGLVIGVVVLAGLKKLELRMKRQKTAQLRLETTADSPTEEQLREMLHQKGYRLATWKVRYMGHAVRQALCEVRYMGRDEEPHTPAFVRELAAMPTVSKVTWRC